MQHLGVSLLLALSIGSVTAPAHGQSRARLVYEVPAVCPGADDFVAAVAKRGEMFERTDNAGIALHLQIDNDANGFSGALQVERGKVTSAPRRVRATHCVEVIEGLAVVAAIALREHASAKSSSASADTAAGPSPRATEPGVGVEAQVAPEPPHPAEPSRPASIAKSSPDSLRGGSWGNEKKVLVPAGEVEFVEPRALTLSAGVSVGWIPGAVLQRYELNTTQANFVSTPSGFSRLVGPVSQVRWTWIDGGTHRASDGYETKTRAILAGVNACSAITYDTRGLIALACGQFAAGIWHFEVDDPAGQEVSTQDMATGTAGLGVDLQYNLGKLFHVDLKLGGEFAWKVSPRRPDGSILFESRLFNGYAQAGFGIQY